MADEVDGDVVFHVEEPAYPAPEQDGAAEEAEGMGVSEYGDSRGASSERNQEQEEASDEEEEEDSDEEDEAEVPLFANRENRLIRKEIVRMEKKIELLKSKVDEDEDRQKAMQDHVKSVEQEFRHAEQLLASKSKELHSEEHMKQLSERDAGRIRAEIARTAGKKEELLGQLTAVQNEIFTANEQMDKYKLSMNFDQEELEQWTLAMSQNKDDQEAFEKYMKVDSAKVKELNFTIEKLTVQLAEKKKQLDDEVTETQAKQIELDKTAEEFRARHKERQDVLRQWQDAIAQVKARDEEIQRAGQLYAGAKDQLRGSQKELEAEKARLESLKQDCIDMESKSKMVDNVLQKKRNEEVEAKAKVEHFKAEVELLKTEVGKASSEVERERQRLENTTSEVAVVKQRLEEARERFEESKIKLAEAKNENANADISASAAEEILKSREAEVKAIEIKLAQMKEEQFRESKELFEFRQKESNLLAEISGVVATGKNLTSEIKTLDDQSLRQKEIVYTAEFQIQQLERRVARASGVRSDDEKKVLSKKIAACQGELDAAQAQNTMLVAQVKNLEEELKTTKRTALATVAARKELNSRLDELKLENSSAEATLMQVMKSKEEMMVNNDLMKLQVKGLRDQLSDRADKVFGLENRQFQLEMSMQERKKEIEVHTQVQRARAKLAEEERHKVAMEAKECGLKVQKLEKKFATICKSGSLGEDGKERSQAYFVIAAAQKREELQREGDELDSKIRKASREIRALEETLSNINSLNSQFRSAAHRADPKSAEAMELKRLYSESKAARDTAFKKKKELQRLVNDLNEDERRIAQLQEQHKFADENRIHLERTQQQVEAELDEQASALSRAEAKLREHAHHHRASLGIPADRESVHETMFQIEINNQTRDSVLYTLGQLSKEFPEMEDEVQTQLGRFGLNIPTMPPTTPGSMDSTSIP